LLISASTTSLTASSLTARVRAWRAGGTFVEVNGRQLFLQLAAGRGPQLLFLHGYPSSSYDWRLVFERVPELRMACFDMLGFGLSEKPRDHVYSLRDQADLVEGVVRQLDADEIVLVAHDMGTSVATELLARDLEGRLPFRLLSVLLLNGSMVIERASLTPSQKLLRSRLGPVAARLSTERTFRAQFARIFSRDHPLTREEAADQWSLLAHDGGNRILHRLTYYLHERVTYADRWHDALRYWPGQLELAWAMRDPVCTEAVLDAILELRAYAPVTRFAELGHYPQLEAPKAIAPIVARMAAVQV
jgi:pimeloyl-ACP methyl ester carboxylesterase